MEKSRESCSDNFWTMIEKIIVIDMIHDEENHGRQVNPKNQGSDCLNRD